MGIPAQALINPRFTPVHLVKQSALIVSVDVKQGESKDQYTAAIREVLRLSRKKAASPELS